MASNSNTLKEPLGVIENAPVEHKDSTVIVNELPKVQEEKQDLSNVEVIQQPPSVSGSESGVTPFLGIGSLVLVIIGWRVIYHNAKKLATRTESKSFIEDVTKILADIENLSVDYWLAGRRSRIETEQFILLINAKLITLKSRLDILKNRAINIDVVDLSKILEYSTLECEEVDSKSDSYKRERVQELLDEINTAHSNLYNQFQELYKPSFGLMKRFSLQ